MKEKNVRKYLFMLVLIVLTLACGLPSASSTESPPVADVTEVPATESAQTTEPSIQHNDIPVNLPSQHSGQAGDFDSSKVISNGTLVGGDRFTFGRFERPFNANAMDTYFSQLDIVNTQVFQDNTWIYANITLQELTPTSSLNEKYAVEIDIDLNGKGDWLIIGFKPSSTEWTVNGVQIYQDANKDVGLSLATLTDEGAIASGDGFESKIFDQGKGDDSDAAWVRISPNDANTIEFAIKLSVLGSPTKFLINMWAGTSLIDPALFDINDSFTHEQAGAADAGLSIFYPIKEVAEIDNSCRMAVGFQPTGNEPGLCSTFIPVVEGNPPTPAPGGCQATTGQIQACMADASYTWNPATCTCQYTGPK